MTTFRLAPGTPAPVQGGDTTCGPAALTVARMLVDPTLAAWVTTGDTGRGRALLEGSASEGTPAERFAAYEGVVHRRVTSTAGPGGAAQVPWPRALGTPPWGARRELEDLARPSGTRYRSVLVRHLPAARRARLFECLRAHLTPTQPGLLYVGSPFLPRHVALLVPGAGGLAVYDPGDGSVGPLDVAGISAALAPIGGWRMPWWLIGPVGSGFPADTELRDDSLAR